MCSNQQRSRNKFTHNLSYCGLFMGLTAVTAGLTKKMPLEKKHYQFYSAGLFIIFLLVAFHQRNNWLPKFRAWLTRRRIRRGGYLGVSSFENDIENGLTSDQFDLSGNLEGDSRTGLDENAKSKIKEIMEVKGISFDAARLEYTRANFQQNNIGPDGMPLDPKAVTFSR